MVLRASFGAHSVEATSSWLSVKNEAEHPREYQEGELALAVVKKTFLQGFTEESEASKVSLRARDSKYSAEDRYSLLEDLTEQRRATAFSPRF